MRMPAGQQVEGMRRDQQQDREPLHRSARGPRQVADQALAPGARGRARQHAEAAAAGVARAPDRLDDPRRLTFDDRTRSLGREVARAETGTTGGDDQTREPVGEVGQCLGDRFGAVARYAVLDHLVARGCELFDQRAAAGVVARTAGAFKSDKPPLAPKELREAAERAMAEEVEERMRE